MKSKRIKSVLALNKQTIIALNNGQNGNIGAGFVTTSGIVSATCAGR